MLVIEGAIGLPNGKGQVEQLAQAVTDGHVTAATLGLEAAIEGAEGGVVAEGGAGGVPQVVTNQVVALRDLRSVPEGSGWPCWSTPERFSSGKTPK